MFKTHWPSILAALSLAVPLSGCGAGFQQSLKKGVVGSVDADVGSFASATVNSLGVEHIELQKDRLTRLRVYFDEDAPEVKRLSGLLDNVLELRRMVVLFSLDLVQLSSHDISPKSNVARLAQLADARFRTKLIELGMEAREVDAAVTKIEEQKKLLGAIRAVNPLIALFARENERLALEIEDTALPGALSLLDQAIEKDFEKMRRHLRTLDSRRKTLLEGLELIAEARLEVPEAEAELQDRRIFLARSMTPSIKPTENELNRAEHYLIEELEKDALIRSLIAPREQSYLAAREEYDTERAHLRRSLQIARVQFAAWQRAYEALGNGVENPGKWLMFAAKLAGAAL